MTWDLNHIVALIFPVLGLWMLVGGIGEMIVGLASRQWLSVEGTITRSYVTHKDFAGDDGPRKAHFPEVIYTFVTDGIRYEGKRLRIRKASMGPYEVARDLIAPYPPGARVTIYYEPGKPQKSVLEPGVCPSTWFIIGSGVFFLGMSWILIRPLF